jgi:hypothetical protein
MARGMSSDEDFDDEESSDGFDEGEESFDDGDEGEESDAAPVEGESDDDEEPSDVTIVSLDDDEDLSLDQDVELALDQVLAEQMRVGSDLDDDDDAPVEPEAAAENSDTVLPKQDDEFRCKSCRLLKKLSQLADKKATLCRDCV